MDSALRPREIQSRIRAGQSLEEVAQAAGVPAERIEAYAAPVLAEREYVAGLALASTIRRHGETGSHRTLRPVIAERLTGEGIDLDIVRWDAWRNEDRRWSVRAAWSQDGGDRTALFNFDLPGRFSVAVDDAARWLISEPTQAELEEAEEADELALVRAVASAPEPIDDADEEPTVSLSEVESVWASRLQTDPTAAAEEEAHSEIPQSAATPMEIGEAVEAEIDSYGLIPDGRSELDVLYDMLGGIAEDSINIYAGLSDPVVPPSIDLPAEYLEPTSTSPEARPDPEPGDAEQSGPAASVSEVAAVAAAVEEEEATKAAKPTAASANEAAPGGSSSPQKQTRAASEDPQPPLTDDPEATVAFKPGAAKRRRKGRAHVPSWDEIVFGGPRD